MSDWLIHWNSDEAACARAVAEIRDAYNRGQAPAAGDNITPEQRLRWHYQACLSEIAVARMLNLWWSGCGPGADGRLDVGDCIEVRTVCKARRGLVGRENDKDAPYVLTQIGKGRVWAVGWQHRRIVEEQGELRSPSRKPYRELSRELLLPMSVILDEVEIKR